MQYSWVVYAKNVPCVTEIAPRCNRKINLHFLLSRKFFVESYRGKFPLICRQSFGISAWKSSLELVEKRRFVGEGMNHFGLKCCFVVERRIFTITANIQAGKFTPRFQEEEESHDRRNVKSNNQQVHYTFMIHDSFLQLILSRKIPEVFAIGRNVPYWKKICENRRKLREKILSSEKISKENFSYKTDDRKMLTTCEALILKLLK